MCKLGVLTGIAWMVVLARRAAVRFYNGFDAQLHDWDMPLPGCVADDPLDP